MQHSRIAMGILISIMSPMLAQQAIAQQSNTEVTDEDTLIEKIIVTSSRRGQTIQDVPASVAAVVPDNYTENGLQNIGEVVSYVPGVVFIDQGQPGRGSMSARGIPQAASTPVFGFYLDDTPVSSNTAFGNGGSVFLDGMLIDAERIEIIKGPQGTLYGATSIGGMLRYISKDPELNGYRGSIGLNANSISDGGNGNTVNGRFSTSLVEDVLGVTVSAYNRNVGGYVDFVNPSTGDVTSDADESDVYGYVTDVLYKPTEEFDIRVKYLKQKADYNLASVVNLQGIDSDEAVVGEFTSLNAPGSNTFEYEVASGTISYEQEDFTITSVTSHTKYEGNSANDVTASLALFADILSGQAPGTTTSVEQGSSFSSEKLVQELRVTSKDNTSLEWIAGLYYTDEETENQQYAAAEPTFNLLNIDLPSNYEELAGFGDLTYYFTDNFDVTAGLRVSKTELDLMVNSSGALVGEGSFVSETVEDTITTYLLAARYRIDKRTSLYSRVASGFRPGSTNIPIIDPTTGQNIAEPIIDPDKAWSYEVGAKGGALGGALTYDLSLWAINWDNFQTRIQANGVSTVGNAEDGLSAKGFEISTAYAFETGLKINANVTYTDSTLDSDEPSFGGVSGERIPRLPVWTASLQWRYLFDITEDWYGEYSGGVRYTDSYFSSFSQSISQISVETDSRTLADMSFAISNDDVRLTLYATNLFNSRALVDRSDINLGTAVDSTGIFERPRTVGASISYSF